MNYTMVSLDTCSRGENESYGHQPLREVWWSCASSIRLWSLSSIGGRFYPRLWGRRKHHLSRMQRPSQSPSRFPSRTGQRQGDPVRICWAWEGVSDKQASLETRKNLGRWTYPFHKSNARAEFFAVLGWRCFWTSAPLTIALLIPEPFARARWKKASGDFFFGIASGTGSNSDAAERVGRIEKEGKEGRHENKRVQLCLAASNEGVPRDDWQNNGDKVDR